MKLQFIAFVLIIVHTAERKTQEGIKNSKLLLILLLLSPRFLNYSYNFNGAERTIRGKVSMKLASNKKKGFMNLRFISDKPKISQIAA